MSEPKSCKSNSALRHFLRFAISSIAFQRLAPPPPPAPSPHHQQQQSDASSIENDHPNHDSNETHSKTPTPISTPNPISTNFIDSFIDKEYCGIKGLKFMDAVSDDGAVIYTPGESGVSSPFSSFRFSSLPFDG